MHYNLISKVKTEFVSKLKLRHTLCLKTSDEIQELGSGNEMNSTGIINADHSERTGAASCVRKLGLSSCVKKVEEEMKVGIPLHIHGLWIRKLQISN